MLSTPKTVRYPNYITKLNSFNCVLRLHPLFLAFIRFSASFRINSAKCRALRRRRFAVRCPTSNAKTHGHCGCRRETKCADWSALIDQFGLCCNLRIRHRSAMRRASIRSAAEKFSRRPIVLRTRSATGAFFIVGETIALGCGECLNNYIII